MIAVGGWTHNEPDNERLYRFSYSAATPRSRMKFAQSSVAFLRKYGFDGLDIDWEYPGDEARGGNATLDKDNLVLLADELRKYFDDAPERFELSIAVPASIPTLELGFDLTKLAESVHFFNVMAYDQHGVWDDPHIMGAHSDIGGINAVIDFFITNSSVPSSQVVMGMPAYGRSYTANETSCVALGCPFDEFSNETAIGGCLDTNGFVPFVEIYNWEQQGRGTGYDSIMMDMGTYSAVMVKDDDQLISYDNAETFRAKIDYATEKCLGGSMVWAIDMLPIGEQSASGGRGGGGDSTPTSLLDEEQSVLAFCGTDWDDAISTCSRPCPSGLSDDCEQGETCFAGTPCGAGGVIAVGDTCKVCPDTTTQGTRSWVEIEVELDEPSASISPNERRLQKTTCGDLDYGLLLSVTKDSETCDSVKLDFGQTCCYDYPQEECSLCRKGPVYYSIRSELNVTMPDGTEASCGVVNQMLAPEENDGETCVTTRDALFDDCCYDQCRLCEGQGLKWWVDFEEASARRIQDDGKENEEQWDDEVGGMEEEEVEEIETCSSIDASLYSDFVEDDTDQCLEIKSEYTTNCCYTFPTTPCGLCRQGETSQTLLWANEVTFEGKNVSCGVVDNILNTEE